MQDSDGTNQGGERGEAARLVVGTTDQLRAAIATGDLRGALDAGINLGREVVPQQGSPATKVTSRGTIQNPINAQQNAAVQAMTGIVDVFDDPRQQVAVLSMAMIVAMRRVMQRSGYQARSQRRDYIERAMKHLGGQIRNFINPERSGTAL